MCMFCKNSDVTQSTTTHVVNYKDCIIVINVNSAKKLH